MSDLNFDSSYFSENVSNLTHKSNNSNKMVNLKKDIFSTKTYNKIDGSNKSLLIVEKLSKQKGKFRRSRFGLNNDELKLGTTNKSNIVDYNKDLAFNLANVIVRRRFKYFWGKRDDSEEEKEIQKPIKVEKKSRIIVDMKKIEDERKRKEREERERKEKERIESELREKERREKEKKKELMKTIEINVEERKRENHNYKIIQKITKEIEISNKDVIQNKNKTYKREPQKNNFSAKHTKVNSESDLNGEYETHEIKNQKPEIKTRTITISREHNSKNKINNNTNHYINHNINQVKIEVNKKTTVNESIEIPSLLNRTNNIIAHESKSRNDSNIENKKIIIVNKMGNMNTNSGINKIVVQKNVIKKDIIVNQYENYKTEGNVRNKYKNMKNNKIILADF
jgi:hypothetical protein